jgi:hypothetical protein
MPDKNLKPLVLGAANPAVVAFLSLARRRPCTHGRLLTVATNDPRRSAS